MQRPITSKVQKKQTMDIGIGFIALPIRPSQIVLINYESNPLKFS
jgi:hypothetical protein